MHIISFSMPAHIVPGPVACHCGIVGGSPAEGVCVCAGFCVCEWGDCMMKNVHKKKKFFTIYIVEVTKQLNGSDCKELTITGSFFYMTEFFLVIED